MIAVSQFWRQSGVVVGHREKKPTAHRLRFALFYRQRLCRRLRFAPFYRQSVVVGAYREKSPDGTYLAYFPFGDLRDVRLMLHYHDKIT